MSDQNSSLPVRSEADTDSRVQTKIVDATNPATQQAKVDTDSNLQTRNRGVYDGATNPLPSSGGVVASTRTATPDLTTQTNQISSITNGTVHALDIAMNLGDGSPVSATNPVPVTITADNIGTEIDSYQTNAAVAAGATSNHDYTVTALKTLLLTQVEASASGKAKIEVQIESGVATGVFASRFVQFNSTANTNMSIVLRDPISVAAGVRVRVIRTNKDLLAQDLYSTICGQEV